jgi:hypothetical protein
MTLLRRRPKLLAVAALLATSAGMLAVSPAAHADPTSFDPKTAVVVTRLPLVGGAGRIPLQVQIGHDQVVGFDLSIPAGAGTWTAKHDVALTDLGIHCILQPGTALHYICGQHTMDDANGYHYLKAGKYLVSLPVQRSGSYAGLVGTVSLYKTDSYGEVFSQPSDTFPVVDSSVPRSNAEVRNLTVTDALSGAATRRGDLAVTVTVVGGETKTTGLDVVLPAGFDWTLLSTNGGGQLTCALTASAGSVDAIHCSHTVGGAVLPFPTGVFTAVLRLSEVDSAIPTDNTPTVSLDYANGTTQFPDTYGLFVNYLY